MADAFDLMPIHDRSTGIDHQPMEGLELTDEIRAAVDIEERFVSVTPGAPDVRVLCYRPAGVTDPLPVVLSIHGGAFVLFSPDTFPIMDAGMALAHSCHVVSVDYRLAPEHPYPAAIDDCWEVLLWLDATDELAITAAPVVVTGASAGGALAAALCQMTRDRNGPAIGYQALFIPVTDDRLDTPSMRAFTEGESFTSTAARGMWMHYLGPDADRSSTPPYAAPLRAESFAGLPPACVLTFGNDPLRDEGIQYAMALMEAGTDVELHTAPRAEHGGANLDAPATERSMQILYAAIGEALRSGVTAAQ